MPPQRELPITAHPTNKHRSRQLRLTTARRRAAVLSPMASIVSGLGPTNVMPAFWHSRAKAAFSERKP